MDKIEVARSLVKLHSECRCIAERYGILLDDDFSEAVAQAILLMNLKEGAE